MFAVSGTFPSCFFFQICWVLVFLLKVKPGRYVPRALKIGVLSLNALRHPYTTGFLSSYMHI